MNLGNQTVAIDIFAAAPSYEFSGALAENSQVSLNDLASYFLGINLTYQQLYCTLLDLYVAPMSSAYSFTARIQDGQTLAPNPGGKGIVVQQDPANTWTIQVTDTQQQPFVLEDAYVNFNYEQGNITGLVTASMSVFSAKIDVLWDLSGVFAIQGILPSITVQELATFFFGNTLNSLMQNFPAITFINSAIFIGYQTVNPARYYFGLGTILI